jgi:predicted nicotinamide N-methyase
VAQDGHLGARQTGGWIWEASKVLESVVLREHNVEGLRITELGAGTGYLALRLASVGGFITATDQRSMLGLMVRNVTANQCRLLDASLNVEVEELDWHNPPAELPSADLVLGSDIIYDDRFHEALLGVLGRYANAMGVRCVLGWEERKPAPEASFLRLAAEGGMRCTLLATHGMPTTFTTVDNIRGSSSGERRFVVYSFEAASSRRPPVGTPSVLGQAELSDCGELHDVAIGDFTLRMPAPAYPPGASQYRQQCTAGIALLRPTLSRELDEASAAAAAAAVPVQAASSQPPSPALASGGCRAAGGEQAMVASTADHIWPSSMTLAQALHWPSPTPLVDVRGLAVLELGAGCGLAGLSAWRAGATSVHLTDLMENLPRLRRVVDSQRGDSTAVKVAALDWTCPLPPSIATAHVDVILAADVIFWPGLFHPLLATLAALTCPHERTPPPAHPNRSSEMEDRPVAAPRVILCAVDRLGRLAEFSERARLLGWRLQELTPPPPSATTLSTLPCPDAEMIPFPIMPSRTGLERVVVAPEPRLFEMIRDTHEAR